MPHVRKHDLVSRVVNGELVILDRRSGYIHQLNTTASCIWEALEPVRSAEDIARRLADSFENPPDTVQLLQDVQTALADFRRRGLLVDEDQPGEP